MLYESPTSIGLFYKDESKSLEADSCKNRKVSKFRNNNDAVLSNCISSYVPLTNFPMEMAPTYQVVFTASTTINHVASVDFLASAIALGRSLQSSSIQDNEQAVRSALCKIYELDKAGHARIAAQEAMIFIEKNLKINGLFTANKLLATADLTLLSSRSLIGLIRSTCRAKDFLPAWEQAYIKSRRQVKKLGKNPNSLFIGLPFVQDDVDA